MKFKKEEEMLAYMESIVTKKVKFYKGDWFNPEYGDKVLLLKDRFSSGIWQVRRTGTHLIPRNNPEWGYSVLANSLEDAVFYRFDLKSLTLVRTSREKLKEILDKWYKERV